MPENISIIVAFSAGLFSFLSPCVLPLVPVYLASLWGTEVYGARSGGRRVLLLLHSLSFIIGFSAIFTTLGAIAGLTGFAINLNSALLNKIAGVLLIVFGIFMLAAMKIPWLNYEKRLKPSLGNTTGYLRSFLIGSVFALSWTACVGPVLGAVLTLAMNSATAGRGAYLLAIYSSGLGLPFLIIGAVFDSVSPLLKRIYRYSDIIHIISGLLLIIMGVLVLTNSLNFIYSISPY